MNIFARRRKESSQAKSGTVTNAAVSILAASLPKSYRQQQQNGISTPTKKSKGESSLPATPLPPTPSTAGISNGNLDKENVNATPRAHHATAPARTGNAQHVPQMHINELGQMQFEDSTAQPAFMVNGSGVGQQHHTPAAAAATLPGKHSLPPIPRDPSSKKDLNLKALPNLKIANRRMSTGSIPSIDAMLSSNRMPETAELQLCYGYWPIETQVELNLVQIEEIVRQCGHEIRTRGIEAPLLFSTQALDISMEGVCSLIRSYLGNRDAWRRDLRFANPHDLCGMIKWALGRYINPQGGRGFLAWDMYDRWRFGEREKDFPPRYITTHMLYLLPTQNAALLTTLFSLMTTALAYTTKNGCTVRKLATLFSSYIFGLPDDETFEHTYTAFNRFSHATEHLLLAYLRDQVHLHEASGTVTTLPARHYDLIKDYEHNLPTNLNKPPQGADLQSIVRIRRHVRWYSKNLIASAGTWEVPRSKTWALIAPLPQPKSADPSSLHDESKASSFVYSSKYKHLLNIRNIADEEDEEDMQKFSSMVEKEWKSFMQSGFAPPDAAKLRFDLTESDRANRRKKHETIDWTTFENSGFQGRETFLDVDLNFNPGANDPLNKEDLLSEARAKLIAERARNVEKSLPPFNYDITPREERGVQIDKQFLEVYSDVLCSSGWTREEAKESSWALIQFKTRSKAQDRPLSAGSDGRTDDTWFLVEELVPADYRASLLEQAHSKPKTSRRISFLRPVRKKQSKQAAPVVPDISRPLGFFNRSSETVFRPNKTGLSQFRQQATPVVRSGSPNLKTPDDSVFAGGPTKVIKLSNSIISPGISNASSLTGHEEETEAIDAPPVVVDKDEVKSINSSQHGHTGIGYSRPSTSSGTGSGFLDMVRKTTRRNRRSLLGQAEVTAPVENQSIPSSPASTVMPGSPGFNLAEHGVSGAGRPMDNPNEWMDRMARMSSARPDLGPQRYERSTASFAGTTHSIETRVTSGHSDSSVHSASPQRTNKQALARETSHTLSEGRDSASIYDRDLPAPPQGQATERPFSSATQDAEELVVAYSQPRDSIAASQVGDGNPYDGLAEDEETVEDHQNGNSSCPSPSPSPPKSKVLPKLSVTAPDSTKGRNSPDEGSVNRRKNLRSISSQGSRDAKHVSKALPSPHDVEELLKSPTVPVNGTGRVGNLAGKFGGVLPKSHNPVK